MYQWLTFYFNIVYPNERDIKSCISILSLHADIGINSATGFL